MNFTFLAMRPRTAITNSFEIIDCVNVMFLNESWVVLRTETAKQQHNLGLDVGFMSVPKLVKDHIPVPPGVSYRPTFSL